jgi:putative tryptophan/tyrosine transport system substrate-binding protein
MELQSTARTLGLRRQSLELRDPNALEPAFAAIIREHAEALIVISNPPLFAHRTQLAALAAKSRLPPMYAMRARGSWRPGVLRAELSCPVAPCRCLRGQDPEGSQAWGPAGEQPTTFELVINLKTAEVLGLAIPPTLLFQASEVIR